MTRRISLRRILRPRLLCIFLTLVLISSSAPAKDTLRIEDMMHFTDIRHTATSADGRWIGWSETPDRGDRTAVLKSLESNKVMKVERGSDIEFSRDGAWAAVKVDIPYSEKVKDSKDKDKPGAMIVNLVADTLMPFDSVQQRTFSRDSRWLALHFYKAEKSKRKDKQKDKDQDTSGVGAAVPDSTTADSTEVKLREEHAGSRLLLIDLNSNRREFIDNVTRFAFDSTGRYLAFSIADKSGEQNALMVKPLDRPGDDAVLPIHSAPYLHFNNLTWNSRSGDLAYLACPEDSNEHINVGKLMLWRPGSSTREIDISTNVGAEFRLPFNNTLQWTRDGERLYFGLVHVSRSEIDRLAAIEEDKDKEQDSSALFNKDKVREEAGLSVWHWADSLIAPQQRKMWKRVDENLYDAVYHLTSDRVVQLADLNMPAIRRSQNATRALGFSSLPYLRESTWAGWFNDVYEVDLQTGKRTLLLNNFEDESDHISLSPGGKYTAYYLDSAWSLRDNKTGTTRNLTSGIATPFYNETHDYPRPAPGYDVAGWTQNDEAVLIRDRFDIWMFPSKGGAGKRITKNGRETQQRFGIVNTDSLRMWIDTKENLLLQAFSEKTKSSSFHELNIDSGKLRTLLAENRRFTSVMKAEDSGLIVFKKESFDVYPDLWVTNLQFRNPVKISNGQQQLDSLLWGTSELVEWTSLDGLPLEGVLIKPANYDPNKTYPVIVYFYRLWSWRLHDFWMPRISDGLSASYYASNGYCVFVPDVKFEVGYPGPSAVRCIVPGVQKLIDMGVADPARVGIHGHSWSGYQTAYVITQSDMFAAALAGAPVGNMTSAYSGIRLGSGLARQFQYEHYQSRIGGSLWDVPMRYIENSPVFYADRINTPLMIMFGDKDDAVPWPQGIELYLALRRFNKPCVMLQYHNEPHHLKEFGNQIDYMIRVKQFFDHFLDDAPAPSWWQTGEPYLGE